MEERADALSVCNRIFLCKESVSALLAHPGRLHTCNEGALLLLIFAEAPGSGPPQEVETLDLHL